MKLFRIKDTDNIDFYAADISTELALPFFNNGIVAGFPSPADDYLALALDLNIEFVKNPNSTFYGRVKGNSMIDAGISEGDVLIIDKSIEPLEGTIAVCYIDGEFTVKRIKLNVDGCNLKPANDKFQPIKVTSENDYVVWGVVTYVIKKMQ